MDENRGEDEIGKLRQEIEGLKATNLGLKRLLDQFKKAEDNDTRDFNSLRQFIRDFQDIACRRVSEALKQPDMFIEKPARAARTERPAGLFDTTGS